MKVCIVGEGQLEIVVQEYLTVGKVYDAEEHPAAVDGLALVKCDDGRPITVNVKYAHLCGHIFDAAGDLRWEAVADGNA